MRKLIAFIVILLLLFISVHAESSIDGMTYDELIELQESLNIEIWKRGNWHRVVVPEGWYTVGKQIPEGKYNIINLPGLKAYITIYQDEVKIESAYIDGEYYYVELLEGMTVNVDGICASAVFCPEEYKPLFSSNGIVSEDCTSLFNLAQDIDAKLRTMDNWEEVVVPPGLWEIGKHIPAGLWTIWPMENSHASMFCSDRLNDQGYPDKWAVRNGNGFILSPSNPEYDPHIFKDRWSIDVPDGWYFYVELDSVIFTPYTGIPLFEFEE